jgi:hypothetical protein
MGLNLSRSVTRNAVYGILSSTAKTVYSDKVDLSGAKGVVFTALFKSSGASTGHATFTVVGTDTSTAASTSYTAITGASVTVENSTTPTDKRVCNIDCCNPIYRYVKAKLVKQAGIFLNGIVAQKYGLSVEPASASTTYAGSTAALSNVLVVGAT